MEKQIKQFKKMPLIEKACVIAVGLAEEKYEILEFLNNLLKDEEKENIYAHVDKLVEVYQKISGGEK